jgi:membrane-bound serine protease (ClpP class)
MNLRSALLLMGLSLFFVLDDLILLFFLDQFTPLEMSRPVLTVAIIVACIFSILVGWLVLRAMQLKPATGKEGLAGEKGMALTPLNPRGQVSVHGEIWRAVSEEPISEGETIQVVRVIGMQLHVKKATETLIWKAD